jgi:hypothetical protein
VRLFLFSVVVVAVLRATLVSGADLSAPPAVQASPARPWDLAFGSALMSDHNIRGISVSARGPSLTAYFEPRYKMNPYLDFYAGLSGASVDVPNRATAQFVYYAGLRPTVGAVTFDLGLAYIDYPGGILFNGIGSPAPCSSGAFFFGQCNTKAGRSLSIHSSPCIQRGFARRAAA